jgi:hypothetical protein
MKVILVNCRLRQPVQRLLRLGLVPLLGLLIWAGCRQNGKGGSTNPVGNYALVSVNGSKVPCTVLHEGQSIAVQSGNFTINPDGTCSSKVVFSGPSGGQAAREVQATYASEGSKLIMHWRGAGTTTGTVQGDTFTMNNEGMVFAYRK